MACIFAGMCRRLFPFVLPLILAIGLSACNDVRIYESYQSIPGHEWEYKDIRKFTFEVKKPATAKVFVNLRNSEAYLYNNLWVQMHIRRPNGKIDSKRFQFKLADTEGNWLGMGAGDIYDNRFPVIDNYPLSETGTYTFEIQHDMRPESIEGVMDVGVRVESK